MPSLIDKHNNIILKGGKVTLRPMLEEDAELIVLWRNDPEIRRWFFSNEPLTVASHLEWFKRQNDDRLDFVITLHDSKCPVGTLNFKNIDFAKAMAEAGKMIGDRSQRGKGLAKEAFCLWLAFGFESLKLNNIYVHTLSTNSKT